MIKELVYLGTPYSGTKEEMHFRAQVVDVIAKDLSNQGVMVYSPISSWHNISSVYDMPTNYAFWQDMCETIISKCDKLIAVLLPGWQTSVGLKGEVGFARKYNIDIEYLDPAPYLKKFGILI